MIRFREKLSQETRQCIAESASQLHLHAQRRDDEHTWRSRGTSLKLGDSWVSCRSMDSIERGLERHARRLIKQAESYDGAERSKAASDAYAHLLPPELIAALATDSREATQVAILSNERAVERLPDEVMVRLLWNPGRDVMPVIARSSSIIRAADLDSILKLLELGDLATRIALLSNKSFYAKLTEGGRQEVIDQIKPKLVVVVRTDIISNGKSAAQTGHAVLEAYELTRQSHPELVRRWKENGETKIVLGVDNGDDLEALFLWVKDQRMPSGLIRDAGLTQVPPGTVTALWIGPWGREEIDSVTSKLRLLK